MNGNNVNRPNVTFVLDDQTKHSEKHALVMKELHDKVKQVQADTEVVGQVSQDKWDKLMKDVNNP